jgi:hypothetical protein
VKASVSKANLRRLASLSALSVGALGLAPATAEASSIVYSGVLNDNLFFGANLSGPNGAGGKFENVYCVVTCNTLADAVVLSAKAGAKGTNFRFLATQRWILGFPANAVWGTRFQGKSAAAGDVWLGNFSISFTEFNAADRYLLFRFVGGSLPFAEYGWAQLDVTPTAITLVDYAYDTSSAQIPAGETGTPEPSTFALTGLAALALGAKGLRAWRAARRLTHSTQ